jgi:hypothetical protein
MGYSAMLQACRMLGAAPIVRAFGRRRRDASTPPLARCFFVWRIHYPSNYPRKHQDIRHYVA